MGQEANQGMAKTFCAARPVRSVLPRLQEAVIRPEMLRRVLGAELPASLLLAAGAAPQREAFKAMIGPMQTFYLRLWFIYATDDDGKRNGQPAKTLAELKPIIQAVVDGMRKDWAGTGIEPVYLADRDLEVRKDSKLYRGIVLTPTQAKAFPAVGETSDPAIKATIKSGSTDAHRNAVAAERPNTILCVLGANSTIEKETAASGKTFWVYKPHVGGSFSGDGLDFAMLNQNDFTSSVKASGEDSSRAVHEIGHFLHLPHTHQEDENLHDEIAMPDGTSVADRLAAYKTRIANWIDKKVPAKSTAAKALETFDADRWAYDDTPADPSGGILSLVNGGALGAEMGAKGSVSVTTKNAGVVTFTPDRFNVMSYFLGGNPADPMRFSAGQIERMRSALVNGNRRRLVAAQLGDTAEPSVRIAAVWSPQAKGQAITWRKSVATLIDRHGGHVKNGFRMTGLSAYVVGGQVFYDAFWDAGNAHPEQPLLLGWAESHAVKEIAARALQGWGVSHVQAYRHPGTDLRYNVVFERGLPPQTVHLNQSSAQVDVLWKLKMPAGKRFRCLDSAIDHTGDTRYAVVMEQASQVQRPLWGWALEHLAPEYDKEAGAGRRLRSLSVVPTPAGPRYTAVFDAESQGQLVYWLHVRERIAEVYDEMWWQGFKLRSLDTIAT